MAARRVADVLLGDPWPTASDALLPPALCVCVCVYVCVCVFWAVCCDGAESHQQATHRVTTQRRARNRYYYCHLFRNLASGLEQFWLQALEKSVDALSFLLCRTTWSVQLRRLPLCHRCVRACVLGRRRVYIRVLACVRSCSECRTRRLPTSFLRVCAAKSCLGTRKKKKKKKRCCSSTLPRQ